MDALLNSEEQATVSPENLAKLSRVRTWSDFLALPWQLQVVARRICPTLPEQLEKRHFVTVNKGVAK